MASGGLVMTACKNKEFKIDQSKLDATSGKDGVEYSYTTYDNSSFNDYDSGNNTAVVNSSVLKEQWPTGIADPYIMRYNGTYYLYVTTSGLTNYGLRAWKSVDLQNWTQCQGEGLPLGYVVSPYGQDQSMFGQEVLYTQNAYAPEVYYFNGKFYMFISPGYAANPRGHYVLVSDHPEGPFDYFAGPLDTRIDASLLIDDDERVYYFHATPNGITVRELTDMNTLGDEAFIENSDLMGAWTEGPAMTKVDGKYYLTYTGLHYQTPGYQVCYAVADSLDKSSIESVAASFKRGANNPMLLNCDVDEGHVGNGHSANFLGPDLDSYYIVYHNLDELYDDGMTHRSVNIDRLLVSGGLMTVAQNKTGSIAPTFPRFYAWGTEKGFEKNGNDYLSTAVSNERFTAEFNSGKDGNVKYVVSYQSESDYAYVQVDYAAKKILLKQVKGGAESSIASGTLVNDFKAEDNHTIRVAYGEGEANVYFDNMCKISAKCTLGGGKIGYKASGAIEIGYTALSDQANGSSDRAEIKQSHGDVPATAYMPEGQIAGVGSYVLTGESGVRETNGTKSEYLGTSELYLASAYDYARYLVNFKQSGSYGLSLVVNKKDCGKTICVEIDGGKNELFKIPEVGETDQDYVRVLLPSFEIAAGVRQVKIQNAGQDFAFVSLAFDPLDQTYSYENALNTASAPDSKIVTGTYELKDGAFRTSGSRSFMPFGNQNLHDFEASIDIAIDSGVFEPIGVIFRQDNYANAVVPGQNFTDAYCHIQGYYLQVKNNSLTISRYNYGKVKSYDLGRVVLKAEANRFYTYKIVAEGNTFTVWRDGEKVLQVTDPLAFQTGAFGLYSTGGSGSYKNVKIQAK